MKCCVRRTAHVTTYNMVWGAPVRTEVSRVLKVHIWPNHFRHSHLSLKLSQPLHPNRKGSGSSLAVRFPYPNTLGRCPGGERRNFFQDIINEDLWLLWVYRSISKKADWPLKKNKYGESLTCILNWFDNFDIASCNLSILVLILSSRSSRSVNSTLENTIDSGLICTFSADFLRRFYDIALLFTVMFSFGENTNWRGEYRHQILHIRCTLFVIHFNA